MMTGDDEQVSPEEYARQLWRSFEFIAACELQLLANEDLLKADRMDWRFPPWANFLRKRAARRIAQAERLCPAAYNGNYPREDAT